MKTGMSLQAMCDEVRRQQAAKADYAVITSSLEMEAYGSDVVLRLLDDDQVDAIEPMNITQVAHQQFSKHLGIPLRYYMRLLEEYPDLLAANVNTFFQREPSQRMLRTMFGDARAWLSNRYRRIDNLDVLQATLPILGQIQDAQFESCEITPNRMYLKVVNPRLQTEVSPGDIVQAGVAISNSEIGLGAVCVQPLVFRLICRNGMIVNDSKTRRNHVGRVTSMDENYMLYTDATLEADDTTFLMKIQDTVRAAVDEALFTVVVDKMREAKDARMTTTDISGFVKLASKDYGLSESEGDGVLQQLIEGRDLSLYGLANAVTRHSQDVSDYDRCTELEGIGYDIMTMSPQQWTQYNQAALPAAA